jgi:hypothetical protein
MPGAAGPIAIEVRNASFEPVTQAELSVRVSMPGGEVRALSPRLIDARSARYEADMRFDQPGVYRVDAEARERSEVLGTSQRWMLVGAADLEMADPRLNEEVLRRVSRASNGQYVPASDIAQLPSLLAAAPKVPGAPRLEELWHNPLIFAAVIILLAAEWTLRRQWGLR